jgi:hypothetical protein
MLLAILFHFLYAQHVSDINISIFRSLRLCCWITTSVVLFCKDGWFSVSVNLRCMVVCVWCDVFCRFVVVGTCILIDTDRYLLSLWTPPKTSRTKSPTRNELRYVQSQIHITKYINNATDVVIQQHSRRFLKMDILMSETCWAHKTAVVIQQHSRRLLKMDILMSETRWAHKTDVVIQQHSRRLLKMDILMSETCWPHKTDVVIQQHGRRLLKMDILMSETCWAHKKWNKIARDIKLVFHSSSITMMHGPINIRFINDFTCVPMAFHPTRLFAARRNQ